MPYDGINGFVMASKGAEKIAMAVPEKSDPEPIVPGEKFNACGSESPERAHRGFD
jgi:hypothetical protein